jgi:hypothetical protein
MHVAAKKVCFSYRQTFINSTQEIVLLLTYHLIFLLTCIIRVLKHALDPRPVSVYAPSAELEDAAGEVATGSEDAMGREPHRLQQLQAMLQSTV